MKKIMLVFGTRPEAIKMAPLVIELNKHPEKYLTQVCVTGQHKQMLHQVLNLFGIIPDYDLDIMKAHQDLYDVTSRVLLGMRDVLNESKPDFVLVHGDTTTSMAAAIAAFYQQIPVVHIEAGLRTNNIYSPWPEEINRQVISCIAAYNFAPTASSRENLLHENVQEDRIAVTGNTVIDALFMTLNIIKGNKEIESQIHKNLYDMGYNVERLNSGRKMILITGHRRENFGEGFLNICNSIKTLGEKYPDIDFVYPMHLNPNVRNAVDSVFGKNKNYENLFFIEPLEYREFVYLMDKCYMILTDSGGVQEEAPSLGKPVLVMRETTERPEAVDAGTVKLVGTDTELIIRETSEIIENEECYSRISRSINPYGDGKACERIVNNKIFND